MIADISDIEHIHATLSHKIQGSSHTQNDDLNTFCKCILSLSPPPPFLALSFSMKGCLKCKVLAKYSVNIAADKKTEQSNS